MSEKTADWTTGAEAIVYQSCSACGHLQYFHRSFCVSCGAPDPELKLASGAGTVYATSLVCRAATPETRAHVPYNIILVDASEGFRMMAHGDNELAIGDEVTARFMPFAGRLVPFFWRRCRDLSTSLRAQRSNPAFLQPVKSWIASSLRSSQ